MLLQRRPFIGSLGVSLLSGEYDLHIIPFEEAVRRIQHQCPPVFLAAVKSGGKFLYRGENVHNRPCILQPPSDLLDLATYGSEQALAFFQCLEDRLQHCPIRPSTGHIGTAHREDAAAWGQPCSVWPLGTEETFHYLWPRSSSLFYPGSNCTDDGEFVIDKDLTSALQLEKEIMFCSSSFLVVPMKYETQLRHVLFV